MKFLKLGLLAAAAVVATMAFAGVASATTVTSPTGTTYTSAFKATAGATNLTGSFVKVECESSALEGNVTQHGAGVTSGIVLAAWTSSGCNYSFTWIKVGYFEFHWISSSENFAYTWSGGEFWIHTSVGTCVFTTNNTPIGTVQAGSPAKLEIASAKIPRTGGNFLCGSSATWNGSYTVNTPSSLYGDS